MSNSQSGSRSGSAMPGEKICAGIGGFLVAFFFAAPVYEATIDRAEAHVAEHFPWLSLWLLSLGWGTVCFLGLFGVTLMALTASLRFVWAKVGSMLLGN
ncbi:hypothetical protein [Novosphingobium beihaiensis]|uniref:DUF4870 domain-containing protein n=1 Tax=Novosphingobium beihaiensis TaxID=2930389 RepID=A0ABT0BSE1_9SPHN|nr:hypothetical protein [Novosphingobium beihaiensis]MCJ2187898.1 hypothetical protein [Novosphingobium beihaiensis]